MKRYLLFTIGAASFLACSGEPPTAPKPETSLLSLQPQRVGGGASATGGWRDVFAAGPPTGFRNVSFSAVSTGRGAVMGNLHINNRSPGSDRNWHGSVDCLIVNGERATVGGVILRTREAEGNTFQLIPGTRWWFQVVDNGEGAGSAADERTNVVVNGTRTCQAVVDDLGVLATVPITDGNIQVRPSPTMIESLLLPSDAASVEGNSANSSPFEGAPGRFQSVYGAALLGLPVGARITGMRFRLDGGETSFGNVTISNFEIRLSTSTNQPGSLSATFAANRGADEVIVRTGPLTIAPGDYPTGSVPNAFGPTIPFSQPFVYQGGPLLLEIGYTGLPSADARSTDNVFPATAESQSGYGLAGGFNSTTADAGLFQDLIVVEYRFVRP